MKQSRLIPRIERPASLATLVYEQIRELVVSETFEAGERLTETNLCSQLNVSRTPVREALFRLCQDGLVTQSAGRFLVPVPELRDIREIFAMRRLMEPSAVAEVARSARDEDIARLRQARDRFLTAPDFATSLKLNVAFRRLWRDCIPNRRLRDTLNRLDDQIAMVRRATLINVEARALAEEIACQLVTAFENHDPDAARDAMIAFLDGAATYSEQVIRTRTTGTESPGTQPTKQGATTK